MRYDRGLVRLIACGAVLFWAAAAQAQNGAVTWRDAWPVDGGYERTYTYTNFAYVCSADPYVYGSPRGRLSYGATYVDCQVAPWWGGGRPW